VDTRNSSAPARTTKDPATRLPDHELIRLDAAAHPERTYGQHVEAAREITGQTYVEDLQCISPAAQARSPVSSKPKTSASRPGSWPPPHMGHQLAWAPGRRCVGLATPTGPGYPCQEPLPSTLQGEPESRTEAERPTRAEGQPPRQLQGEEVL
jgi:hypothetical protein